MHASMRKLFINLPINIRLTAAVASLVALLLAACGGGGPDAKVDTVAPTVAISHNAGSAPATGSVTVTFTFSEDVGSSFKAEGIVITGAIAAPLVKVDATRYTLLLTPTPNTKGAATLGVPANRFKDLANNWNASASALQLNYDTTPAVTATSGNTGTCLTTSTLNCLDLEPNATTAIAPFGGLTATFAADPANAANRVAQLVKRPGNQVWAGATLGEPTILTVSPVKMGASKVLTLRVYAPAAGETLMLKLENKASNNTLFVTAEAKTTKAGAWETLSFDFDNPTEGTNYNFDTTYDMVSIFPHYGQTVASYTTFYIDELKLKTEERLTGWNLVWSDEFAADGLPDSSKWGYDTARNKLWWFNGEQQYYSNARTQNSVVSGGTLKIIARKETPPSVGDSGGQQYTSARLITRDKQQFTYGFFEVRAKLPCGLGTWPAIWLLGTPENQWPKYGEIDIMEQKGFTAADKKVVSGYLHHPGGSVGAETTVADACTSFHNYQLTWTAHKIVIGVDNLKYFEYVNPKDGNFDNWPYSGPQFLILNVAMGGNLGGPIPAGFVSDQMEVDYVRVYQK
jgi:beta-glucanase (GH16 family)